MKWYKETKEEDVYCHNRSEDCDVLQANYGIAVQSMYDIPLQTMAAIMQKHSITVLKGSFIFSPLILISDEGVVPVVNAHFKKNLEKDEIAFTFVGDSSQGYTHKLSDYLDYVMCNSVNSSGEQQVRRRPQGCGSSTSSGRRTGPAVYCPGAPWTRPCITGPSNCFGPPTDGASRAHRHRSDGLWDHGGHSAATKPARTTTEPLRQAAAPSPPAGGLQNRKQAADTPTARSSRRPATTMPGPTATPTRTSTTTSSWSTTPRPAPPEDPTDVRETSSSRIHASFCHSPNSCYSPSSLIDLSGFYPPIVNLQRL